MLKRFLWCLLLVFMFIPAIALVQPGLTILTEEDPPDQYKDKDGNLRGYAIEIVQELQRRLGNQDPIRMALWSGAYELALSEPNILLFQMNRTKTRENLFYWIGPINEFEHQFWALKDSTLKISTLDDARKIPRIGVYLDDFRDLYLTEKGFTNLDRASTSDANIKKLLAGHLQVMVTSSGGLDGQMANLGYSISEVKPLFTIMRTQSYLAISKKTDPSVATLWSKHLDAMKIDGTFERIFFQWYPKGKLPGKALFPEI